MTDTATATATATATVEATPKNMTEVIALLNDMQSDNSRAEMLHKIAVSVQTSVLKPTPELLAAALQPSMRGVIGAAVGLIRTVATVDPVLALNSLTHHAIEAQHDRVAQRILLREAEWLLTAKPALVQEECVARTRAIHMPYLAPRTLGQNLSKVFRNATLRRAIKTEEENLQIALTSFRLTVDRLKIERVFPAPPAKGKAKAAPKLPAA